MSSARHEQIGAIFSSARRLPPEKRPEYVGRVCAGDEALRRDVEALLREDEDRSGFLDPQHVRRRLGEVAAESLHGGEIPQRIGPFRIVRLIGEGGMGVVYEAEQDDPRRRVALKVIRPGMVTRTLLQRFRHEAQVLAQLRHPGIAQVYQAGTAWGDDGGGQRAGGPQPYFAMELVEGRSLVEFANERRLDVRERLELLAMVCDAVHHAHQKGVIHRDLKPGNILIEEGTKGEGLAQPKILDFGVARVTDADLQAVTLQTGTGQILGTLPYMSPEQAAGEAADLDIRSDVYSLGVIGYELLTARLPHAVSGKMIHEAVRAIREEEPSRLSSIDRALRGDVETIIGKALAKDKAQRYQSAAELAADIRRHLADQPIVARAPSALYQLRKFTRRHKTLVAAVLVVLATMLGATLFSLVQAQRALDARDAARLEKQTALHQARRATIAAAAAALEAGDALTTRRLLDSVEPAGRNWEWHHLRSRFDRSAALIEPGEPLAGAALTGDGSEAVTVARDGTVRWWNAALGDEVASATLEAAPIHAVAFTPDAAHLAALVGADPTELVIWHTEGRTLRRIASTSLPEACARIALAADGRFVLAARDRQAWTWDASQPGAAPVSWEHGLRLYAIDLSRGGTRVAVGGSVPGSYVLMVREARDFAAVSSRKHAREPLSVAFSPDGTLIATGGQDKRIRLSRTDAAQVLAELGGHDDAPTALAFSPLQPILASAAADLTVRLWDVESERPLAILTGHEAPVRDLRFSADGTRLLSLDESAVRVWDVAQDASTLVLRGHGSYVYAVAFSPDGRRVYSGAWDRAIRVWDALGGDCLAEIPAIEGVTALAVSPDGRVLAAGHLGGAISTSDTVAMEPLRSLRSHSDDVAAITFSPDGSRLVSSAPDGTIIRDLASMEVVARMPGTQRLEGGLACSPDGRVIAVSTAEGAALHESSSGDLVVSLSTPAIVYALAFSHDGALLAAGCADGVVRLLDRSGGAPRMELHGHTQRVYTVAFAPDDTRLASGSDDTTIRLWDIETGEAVAQLRGHEDYVFDLAFSPDGRMIASSSGDFTVRLWDTVPVRQRLAERARWRGLRDEARPLVERLGGDPSRSALEIAHAIGGEAAMSEALRRAACDLLLETRLPPSGVACDPFDGAAVELDGASGHVRIGGSEAFRMTGTFTIEAWIEPIDDVPPRIRAIVNREGEYQLSRGPGGLLMWTSTSGPGWNAWRILRHAAPAGQWTHVALVYAPDVATFYVNGHRVGEYPGSGALGGDAHPDQDELWIGGRQLGDPGFRGRLDEVRVWRVARSGEQIRATMRRRVRGDEPGLAGAWCFDEGAGDLAIDQTGTHHGTLVGASWHPTASCDR